MFFLPENKLLENCIIYLTFDQKEPAPITHGTIALLKGTGSIKLINSSLDHTKAFIVQFISTSDFEIQYNKDFVSNPDCILKCILCIDFNNVQYRYTIENLTENDGYAFYTQKKGSFECYLKIERPEKIDHIAVKGNPFPSVKD